jgi:hypothetical protein
MNLKNFLLVNEITIDDIIEASSFVEKETGEYVLSRPTIDNIYKGKGRKPCSSTIVRLIRAVKHIFKQRGYNAQQIINAMGNIEY